jgi:flagellar assembly protein FliH
MSSSKSNLFRNVPPPTGGKPTHAYSRFIPREELSSFAAWKPGSLGGEDSAAPAAPAEPLKTPEQESAELLQAARQGGYHDGYRDGLAALESFKQSFAAQATAQIGVLMNSYAAQMDELQQSMAQALAAAATSLARQIVRSELGARPEQVVTVAHEALETLLLSARYITVRVHPDDHPLVAQGAAELMTARGARLVADASLTRGGCLVESDIGIIDASIETRWRRAAAALGSEVRWDGSIDDDAGDPDDDREAGR